MKYLLQKNNAKNDVKIKKKKQEQICFRHPQRLLTKVIGISLIMAHNEGPFSQKFNKFEGSEKKLCLPMYLKHSENIIFCYNIPIDT